MEARAGGGGEGEIGGKGVILLNDASASARRHHCSYGESDRRGLRVRSALHTGVVIMLINGRRVCAPASLVIRRKRQTRATRPFCFTYLSV